MPKPIFIDNHERSWLFEEIKKIYLIDIQDTFDCIQLKDLIFQKHAIQISLSTLRRIFLLKDYEYGFSAYTLNSLFKSIGFDDFKAFKNHLQSFDTSYWNNLIQLYSLQPEIYRSALIDFLDNIEFDVFNYQEKIQCLVSKTISLKDEALLDSIFKLPFSDSNHEYVIPILFQDIYLSAKLGQDWIIHFIAKRANLSRNIQAYILQSYVDELELNGFFYHWLNSVKKPLIYDFLTFKSLIFTQRAFLSKNMGKARLYLQQARIDLHKIDAHPILKARYVLWDKILGENHVDFNQVYESIKTPIGKIDFIVIHTRLYWQYIESEKSLAFLNEIDEIKPPLTMHYFEQGRYNIYKLTLALNALFENKIEVSLYHFKSVKKFQLGYDIVNFEFYQKWYDKLAKIRIEMKNI